MNIADELTEATKPALKGEVSVDQKNWFPISLGRKRKPSAGASHLTYMACRLAIHHHQTQEEGHSMYDRQSDLGKAMRGMKLGVYGPPNDGVVRVYWRVLDAEGNELDAGWRAAERGSRGNCVGKHVKRTRYSEEAGDLDESRAHGVLLRKKLKEIERLAEEALTLSRRVVQSGEQPRVPPNRPTDYPLLKGQAELRSKVHKHAYDIKVLAKKAVRALDQS